MRVPALSLLGICAACSTAAPRREPAELLATLAPDVPEAAPPVLNHRTDNAYLAAKVGMFAPGGDLGDLDDGVAADLTMGRDLLPAVSVEAQVGYLEAEGTFRNGDFSMWALPLFVNWRFRLPVPIVRPYVGAGLGFLYADYEAVGLYSSTEYLFAWDAFGGLEIEIGSVAFGAEYKYVQAEEADETTELFTIEGQSLTAFLSLRF